MCLATETRLSHLVFLVTILQLLLHLLLLPLIGKKNAKKRLSQDQSKDEAGQQPKVTDTDGATELDSLSLPPKVPLTEPKTEPEDRESKWTNSCCSPFLIFVRLDFANLLFVILSV